MPENLILKSNICLLKIYNYPLQVYCLRIFQFLKTNIIKTKRRVEGGKLDKKKYRAIARYRHISNIIQLNGHSKNKLYSFCFKPKFILCLEDSFLSYSIFFKRLVIGLLFSHVILEIRDRETELGSIFLVYDQKVIKETLN